MPINNLNELRQVKTDLQMYYNAMHKRMAICDLYYRGEYTVDTYKDFQPHIPATAKRKVDKLINHIMSNGRVVKCPPWGESEKVKDTSGRVERFGQGYIDAIERVSRFNPVLGALRHDVLYGMFCLKGPLFIPHLWPQEPVLLGKRGDERKNLLEKYERDRARAFPFLTSVVNPQAILLDPSVDNPEFVFEERLRKAREIKRIWPEWNQGRYTDLADVVWTEYWTKNEYCYLVDDVPVFKDEFKPNGPGFLPYQIGFAGYGEESPMDGPEYQAVGLIYPLISSFNSEAEIKTAVKYFLKVASYGRRRIVEQPMDDLQIGNSPGEIDVVPKRYEMEVEDPPQISADAWRHLSAIKDDVDDGTLPSGMEGRPSVGVDSGKHEAILLGQTRTGMAPIISSVEKVLANHLNNLGVLVADVIGEPVSINGYLSGGQSVETVKPEDFKDHPIFTVRFDGKTPEETDRRKMLGVQLLQARALPWEKICTDYFDEDPVEMRRLFIKEEILQDPRVKEALAAGTIKKYQLVKYIAAVSAANRLADSRETKGAPPAPASLNGLMSMSQAQPGIRQMDRLSPNPTATTMGTPEEVTANV